MTEKLVYKSPYISMIKELLSDGEWHTTHEIMDIIPHSLGFAYVMRQFKAVVIYEKQYAGNARSQNRVVKYKMARAQKQTVKLPCRAEVSRCNGNGCYLACKCDLICTERRAQLRSIPQQAAYIVNNTADLGQALCWY